jgi:AcrR family transcriptional regulator
MSTTAPSLATRLTQGGVLAAGVLVFAKKGFTEARVEDILEAAKIARRTFYKYFSSKEDVLASIYEVATTELLRAVRNAAEDEKDPLASVRHALDVYLDYHVENAALVRVLVEQAVRSDSPLAPHRRRFREDLIRIIDDAVHKTTKKRNDPMLYVAILSALEGISLEVLGAGSNVAGGAPATPEKVGRAKKVMHELLDLLVATH